LYVFVFDYGPSIFVLFVGISALAALLFSLFRPSYSSPDRPEGPPVLLFLTAEIDLYRSSLFGLVLAMSPQKTPSRFWRQRARQEGLEFARRKDKLQCSSYFIYQKRLAMFYVQESTCRLSCSLTTTRRRREERKKAQEQVRKIPLKYFRICSAVPLRQASFTIHGGKISIVSFRRCFGSKYHWSTHVIIHVRFWTICFLPFREVKSNQWVDVTYMKLSAPLIRSPRG